MEQANRVSTALAAVPDTAFALPTDLAGWSVAELVGHLSQVLRSVVTAMSTPSTGRPLPLSDYLAELAPAAEQIRDREVAASAGRGPQQLRSAYDDLRGEVARRLGPPVTDATVAAPRGPMRLGQFLTTRVLELVVHGDDLGRATGIDVVPVRRALGVSCRLLADVLAERAPGRSVEVRIPPYAAVQCIAGPRHTRGNPPSVVECEPMTWIRLGTGRTTWADAVVAGRVVASGERSDLTDSFPLLR